MKAIIQRAGKASVTVNSQVVGEIGKGIVVLLGISSDDTEQNADKMAEKVTNLRIFDDAEGKMNLSCLDIKGDALVISQFTLYGDCRKGRRPSYDKAARPDKAEQLYNYFVNKLKEYSLKIETGVFGAMMSVSIVNEGPVTLIIEI
jgi:D-tyrosyl-tRNA(Tyr) deacylase